jgi:hypothetical protein
MSTMVLRYPHNVRTYQFLTSRRLTVELLVSLQSVTRDVYLGVSFLLLVTEPILVVGVPTFPQCLCETHAIDNKSVKIPL